MLPLSEVAENGEAIMKANQRRFCSGFLAKLFGRSSRKSEDGYRKHDASGGVSPRTKRSTCALVLLALAVSVTLASRAQSVTATPNSTSINGPGNIFLTANVMVNPGGGAPGSVAVADFNGDSKQDIAATNNGCNTCGLTILLGNGSGTFQAPLFTANLGGPYYVAAGDFNGDGKQDLAVIGYVPTNLTTPAVFILLGNGDRTFTLKTTLTGFTTPNAIAIGDFNGDGKLDMAVSESQPGAGTPSSVVMFLGNGDGTMQAPISTTVTGVGNATFMATADFNKDNHLDLVLADLNTNHVVVLLGNGDGTFQAARSFPIAYGGFDVAVGDFNGDGIPDIAATTTAASTVDILLGKGDGNFQPAVSYNAGQLGAPTSYLAVGDFNKDGKLDIITSTGEAFIAAPSSSVSVLLGKGDGTFLPPSLVTTDASSGQLVIADFNGDGNPDWVAGNSQYHVMTLALGNGNGTFQAGMNYALGSAPDVTLADINKDGKLDVVAVDPGSNDVRVLLGNGDGTFQTAIITPVTQPAYGISTGDFNNDGNLEVVMCSSAGPIGSRSVIVMFGKGDGTFGAQANFPTGGGCPGLTLVADFNGDGNPDIAVNLGNNMAILLGNGDGTFQAPKISAALATDGFLGAMAAADLNGDGKLDLVVPDYGGAASGQVAILLGNRDGTFQAPTFLTTNGGATWPVIADFNKDGKLDLAVANQFGTIDVFLGNGNGTFGTPLVLNDVQANIGNPIPISLAAADFNLDGNLDLLVGTNASDVPRGSPIGVPAGLQVFLGNGDGTFTGPQDYFVGGQSNPVLVGDFNGDGAPDVAAGDTGENFVSILLNQTPPPVSVSPKSLAFGNQLVGTSSATQPITITNNGTAATTISAAASGDFTQTNTCPASPATLAVAANCTVNVAFKPTATGVRNGAIAVTHKLAGSPQSVALSGTGVASAPQINSGGIVIHAGTSTAVSPGSIVDIYGTNLAAGALNAPAGSALPRTLGGVQVLVNGAAAPLIYIGPLQIILQMPYDTALGTASVVVVNNNAASAAAPVTVQQAAPFILTYDSNRAVVVNQDGSVNASGNGAKTGDELVAYLIGSGPLDNAIATGAEAPSSPLSREQLVTTVSLGGSNATVKFAGMTPGFAGLMQVNFVIPSLAAGDYPIQVSIGGTASNQPLMTVSK
jgi:uncharacterized protein (TIGR03437 family)